MAGKPWNDLLKAVEEFLTHRRSLNTADRITVITFSDKATYAYFDDEIQNVNVADIRFPKGETSFSNAFARVNKCIKRIKDRSMTMTTTTDTEALNYAIIFMTDEEDKYPENQLDQLASGYGTTIRFCTLVLISDLEPTAISILDQINVRMHGSYYSLAASSELSNAFSEITNNANSNSQL